MLRRKLLGWTGFLICGFVVGAVVALALLQHLLGQTDRFNREAAVMLDDLGTLDGAIVAIESGRLDPAPIRDALTRLETRAAELGPAGGARAACTRVRSLLEPYLAAPAPAADAVSEPMVELHAAVRELSAGLHGYLAERQTSLQRGFRSLVLALTLAAFVMVNLSVFVLLKMVHSVLSPVGALVEGSRELAAERFGHRVKIDRNDEFGELAHAYNRLAEQLETNEQRKTETLHQLAVTLNHGLNNAIAIIELQLRLLDRQSGSNPTLAAHLREIRTCLGRMTGIVASLKHIRRIVLTDYMPGQKMVDLERSVEYSEGELPFPSAPVSRT